MQYLFRFSVALLSENRYNGIVVKATERRVVTISTLFVRALPPLEKASRKPKSNRA